MRTRVLSHATAAFLVVPVSGLAASSARTIFDFRARYGLLLAALRLIGASKAAVGEEVIAFYDEEICKIDVQRAAASAGLTVWTSSSHDAMNFSAPSASKAATTSW